MTSAKSKSQTAVLRMAGSRRTTTKQTINQVFNQADAVGETRWAASRAVAIVQPAVPTRAVNYTPAGAAICWPAAYPAIPHFFGVFGSSIFMVCLPFSAIPHFFGVFGSSIFMVCLPFSAG
jgi:hypothetical protein